LTGSSTSAASEVYNRQLYHLEISPAVGKIGFFADETSKEITIEGKPSVVGRIRTDLEALNRVKRITGLCCDLTLKDLPPILQQAATTHLTTNEREATYA